ncbi:MAG: hypothetical protein V2J55_04910 [Candidatus Competibacteraceae bacterium]|jgi:hypothetical protein|nr:hypothetical protein [Candidatus Competibacteraceae bacterium]
MAKPGDDHAGSTAASDYPVYPGDEPSLCDADTSPPKVQDVKSGSAGNNGGQGVSQRVFCYSFVNNVADVNPRRV